MIEYSGIFTIKKNTKSLADSKASKTRRGAALLRFREEVRRKANENEIRADKSIEYVKYGVVK